MALSPASKELDQYKDKYCMFLLTFRIFNKMNRSREQRSGYIRDWVMEPW